MTPIEQAAQALRELVELHDIKGRIDRADSWEREESRAHMDRVEAYGARIGTAWRNARAALASLEAAKQEPLTDEQINELIRAQSFWKTLANETGWSLTAELHDFARAVLAAAPSPGSGT